MISLFFRWDNKSDQMTQHTRKLERCCCWHQSRRRYSGLIPVLNCRFAHAALTEAGPRVSRSLMKSASPTYYEPEPYLIVAPQTPQWKERSHKICRVCSRFSPLVLLFYFLWSNYAKRNEEEKRQRVARKTLDEKIDSYISKQSNRFKHQESRICHYVRSWHV